MGGLRACGSAVCTHTSDNPCLKLLYSVFLYRGRTFTFRGKSRASFFCITSRGMGMGQSPKPITDVKIHKVPKTTRRHAHAKRRQLYKKYRLSGLGLREAGELAGYSPETAKRMSNLQVEKDVKLSIAQQLDKAGLTDQKIAEELTRIATEAERGIVVNKELEFVQDEKVRVKALDLASTLKGHKVEQNLVVQNQQVVVRVHFPEDKVIEVESADRQD